MIILYLELELRKMIKLILMIFMIFVRHECVNLRAVLFFNIEPFLRVCAFIVFKITINKYNLEKSMLGSKDIFSFCHNLLLN